MKNFAKISIFFLVVLTGFADCGRIVVYEKIEVTKCSSDLDLPEEINATKEELKNCSDFFSFASNLRFKKQECFKYRTIQENEFNRSTCYEVDVSGPKKVDDLKDQFIVTSIKRSGVRSLMIYSSFSERLGDLSKSIFACYNSKFLNSMAKTNGSCDFTGHGPNIKKDLSTLNLM